MRNYTRHGHASDGNESPTYKAWVGIIARCENPRSKSYRIYGGRGIKMHPAWRSSFANFLADMGEKPSPEYSIDRIKSDGNYEPGNCRWADRKTQGNNTSRNKIVELDGERMTLAQAVERRGLNYPTVKTRLLRGMSIADAFSDKHLKLKLDADKAKEIAASDEPNSALAVKFGVTPQAIAAVRKGEVWSHVTGIRRAS